MLASAALGLPLFLRVRLAAERWRLTGAKAWLPAVQITLIPIAFFWCSEAWTDAGTGLQLVHLFSSLTLGLMATTYVGRPEAIWFW